MTIPFYGAKLKIERAKQHIRDLNKCGSKFIKSSTYTILAEYDKEYRCDVLKVSANNIVPDEFLLILGDTLHNLRTALDFVMNDIEFVHTGKRTKYTKFPIYDTRNGLEAAVNGGLKQKAPKEILDFIVNDVQPYKSGNGDAIWHLHQLDIEDKHRLLIANSVVSLIKNIYCENGKGERFTVNATFIVAKNDTLPYKCVGHKNVKITNIGNAVMDIEFGNGLSVCGNSVNETLADITKNVIQTIDGISKLMIYS